MYCKYCGNVMDDKATFCTKCGKRVMENEKPLIEEKPDAPCVEEQKKKSERKILAFAIISLACVVLSLGVLPQTPLIDMFNLWQYFEEGQILYYVYTLIFPLIGLVFSIISRVIARKYKKIYGQVEGAAKVGKKLALAAFIACIVLIVLAIIVIICDLLVVPAIEPDFGSF